MPKPRSFNGVRGSFSFLMNEVEQIFQWQLGSGRPTTPGNEIPIFRIPNGAGGEGWGRGDGSYSDSFLIHQMDSPYSHIITVTDEMHCYNQCSGSVTFWYTDSDPYIRTTDLRIQILFFSLVTYKMSKCPNFFAYYF